MVWRGGIAASCMPQNPVVSVFLSDFISADIAPQNKPSLMFQHRWIARSILIAGLFVGYAQQSSAETFTGEKFLTWKPGSQTFYIGASINMASVIVTQTDNAKARCVNDWHGGHIANDYREILDLIAKFRTYHPQGVILAALQKSCGSLSD